MGPVPKKMDLGSEKMDPGPKKIGPRSDFLGGSNLLGPIFPWEIGPSAEKIGPGTEKNRTWRRNRKIFSDPGPKKMDLGAEQEPIGILAPRKKMGPVPKKMEPGPKKMDLGTEQEPNGILAPEKKWSQVRKKWTQGPKKMDLRSEKNGAGSEKWTQVRNDMDSVGFQQSNPRNGSGSGKMELAP